MLLPLGVSATPQPLKFDLSTVQQFQGKGVPFLHTQGWCVSAWLESWAPLKPLAVLKIWLSGSCAWSRGRASFPQKHVDQKCVHAVSQRARRMLLVQADIAASLS